MSKIKLSPFCTSMSTCMNEPTRDSLTFFYPGMNDGGIILCDDYGSTFCPGATRTIDEYLGDKPEKMISLSGGGGFLIKGCATARPYRI